MPGPKAQYLPQHVNTSQVSFLSNQGSISSGSSVNSHGKRAAPPYTPSAILSISDQYSLDVDPYFWKTHLNRPEPDDILHNPDPRRDKNIDTRGHVLTLRGLANIGCLLFLGLSIVTLFAGYPVITYFTQHPLSTLGGFNLGGINATGQVPSMGGNWGLIDLETPKSAYTIKSFNNPGAEYQLVFSDEFNTDGRTFYPGDDPFWEANDMHYWGTGNLEWYDPAAITTSGGSLRVTLSKKKNHGLNYQGGMMTSWNKFCFTGGLILTSVVLPGANNILGLWPAIWTMGNLGRAGYGATLDGMWPYTYDTCDVGTVKNQTVNGLPLAATTNSYGDSALSFLPGQRLSRCTCPGESHPGPIHSDGSYVGRSAPEIDIFEATVGTSAGEVSQSAQWAPFDSNYEWKNGTNDVFVRDTDVTVLNPYKGGIWQEATSGLSTANQDCYELQTGCYATYGFEYQPGYDDSYITWINDNQIAWTLNPSAVGPDISVEISARPVPQEPMYMIVNLGMSYSFGYVDLEHLTFPTTMSVDWIRVYQPKNAINIGCDPPDFPTAAYIEQYIEAYSNPNITTWVDDFKQTFPKNSWLGEC
ncbi:beta-glucan synthesis-associated [Mycena floridula]|nr:beta-glucan synthesis-associated [Mycena floridula]